MHTNHRRGETRRTGKRRNHYYRKTKRFTKRRLAAEYRAQEKHHMTSTGWALPRLRKTLWRELT